MNQVLLERIDGMNRTMQDLDSRCQSLQLTVDRLTASLSKHEDEGAGQKDKLQQLNVSLSESTGAVNELQHRLGQMQKALGIYFLSQTTLVFF